MALSSDKLSNFKTPLVMLKLDTVDPLNEKTSSLLELNAEELNNLLKTLKSIQRVAQDE